VKFPVIAIILVASSFFTVAHAQIIASPGTNSYLDKSWAYSLTNGKPALDYTNSYPITPETNSPVSKSIQPGAYESSPYTCIVIVPKPTEWSQFYRTPIGTTDTNELPEISMPTDNPGVLLVPLSQTGN
jgi:hypothetical protein